MLTQLIYSSVPFGFDRSTLAGILTAARRNNPLAGVTGALICRQDIYLQLLEGPDAAIDSLFAKIKVDDRHQDLTVLHRDEVEDALFPGWSMLDDPARSWLWTPSEVADDVLTKVPSAEVLAVFERLAREIGAPA